VRGSSRLRHEGGRAADEWRGAKGWQRRVAGADMVRWTGRSAGAHGAAASRSSDARVCVSAVLRGRAWYMHGAPNALHYCVPEIHFLYSPSLVKGCAVKYRWVVAARCGVNALFDSLSGFLPSSLRLLARRSTAERTISIRGQSPSPPGRWSAGRRRSRRFASMKRCRPARVVGVLLPPRSFRRLSSARTHVGRVIRRAPYDARCVRRRLSARVLRWSGRAAPLGAPQCSLVVEDARWGRRRRPRTSRAPRRAPHLHAPCQGRAAHDADSLASLRRVACHSTGGVTEHTTLLSNGRV
jgi:hypothetical protein